jgi:hypothetical protein
MVLYSMSIEPKLGWAKVKEKKEAGRYKMKGKE